MTTSSQLPVPASGGHAGAGPPPLSEATDARPEA
jgi:hypothetical protein